MSVDNLLIEMDEKGKEMKETKVQEEEEEEVEEEVEVQDISKRQRKKAGRIPFLALFTALPFLSNLAAYFSRMLSLLLLLFLLLIQFPSLMLSFSW